ncbi:MAG: rRNA pseudouridine synthase [Erysipelotrichaceae bacterium]|nr:rRNA pseudouridine synthase [Erysipelotrichaceae bacterium]MBQ9986986.1 rRNA pseudouridine synthase [Erysipelotrichales bacterium]MBR3693040.1 rRNA pseudouridine synthase [Erysipelotrichales bacterium]
MERLQKILSQSGVCSRRTAEKYMLDGRVSVNGEVITELGFKVKRGDIVCVDGKQIQRENKVYYVMYKPRGVLSSVSDDRGRKCIVELIDTKERIFPVGRLDYDTSGVIFLTNDGEFSNLITHPKNVISKKYELTAEGILTKEQIRALEAGVVLDDGFRTSPSKVWITKKNPKNNWTQLELTIHEGHNRQVKRMLEAVGSKVTRLHRAYISFVGCKDLRPGEYRLMKPYEVERLRNEALGLNKD